MYKEKIVDVAINVFAKPYQTSLSILSLLRHSGSIIDKIYFQFEPYGSKYDLYQPYIIADYLKDQAICFQPQQWIALSSVDKNQLHNINYRHSIRYQYAWEHTNKKYLFIIHNDVFFFKDILTPLIQNIGSHFAIGQLGQCWNCPASHIQIVQESIPKLSVCHQERYQLFRPTFIELKKLYTVAKQKNIFVRPYLENSESIFQIQPWTLPECRINEWACLVNMDICAPLTIPIGTVLPFGAFYQCGPICLDTSVAWFKGMHKHNLTAKHMDVSKYMQHWIGTGKMTRIKYVKAEKNASYLLKKYFPHFVDWCRTKNVIF